MFKSVEHLVHEFGLPGLFADIFLETLGAPVPAESLILFVSGMAVDGQLNIYAVAAVVFVAAVCGDNVAYLIGRKAGRAVVLHYGSRIGISEKRLQKIEVMLDRRGAYMVISARFIAFVRQLNGITAGTAKMSWPRFFAADLVGCALWTGFWTGIVALIGKEKVILPFFWHHLSLAASVVMAIILGGLLGWWVLRRRKPSASSDA